MKDLQAGLAPESDPLAGEDLLVAALEAFDSGGAEALGHLLERHPRESDRVRAQLERALRLGLVGAGEPPAPPPERLGDFRILEVLGQGAMGVVHRAVQESLGREVALKIVRPEQLYFASARERFRREVELVARLAHPGIAAVHAVGNEGGVPYFAMELVRGATLAEVLEDLAGRAPGELRGADLDRVLALRLGEAPAREPAALFAGPWSEVVTRILREVAEALEHAHRRGVLHRDVKPSNIMVTRAGRVLLMDFGLAGTDGQERLTRSGSQLGSLAYMAPELLAGEERQLDARADVYALGVTAWELLALRLPYASGDPVRVRELSQSAQRPRLSALNASVSWELETVLATALEPDPQRRYASAAALARDLDNVLAQRPIAAREAGALLRARRLAQRHPARTTAVAALLVALLLGPSLYAWQEARARLTIEGQRDDLRDANAALGQARDEARAESRRAQTNFASLQRAVDTLLTQVGDETLRDVPHMEPVRRALLTEALAFYDDLRLQAPDDPALRSETAALLVRSAEIHALLADFQSAERDLRRALALYEACDPGGSGVPSTRLRLGSTLRELGRPAEARAACERALAELDADGLARDEPAHLRAWAEAQHELSLVLADQGDLRGAHAHLEQLTAELRASPAAHASDALLARLAARALDRLAVLEIERIFNAPAEADADARLRSATELHLEARELWREQLAREPDSTALRVGLARNASFLGIALGTLERYQEADLAFREGVELCSDLARDFPGSPVRLRELANLRNNWGALAGMQQRWQDSLGAYQAAHADCLALLAIAPDYPEHHVGLAQALQGEALALWRLGQIETAAELFEKAGAASQDALAGLPGNPSYRRLRAKIHESQAELELDRGRHVEAAQAARRILDASLAPRSPALSAALLARCAVVADTDQRLDVAERTAVADGYRDEALGLFEPLFRKGLTREGLLADPELAGQWESPGVLELIALLE